MKILIRIFVAVVVLLLIAIGVSYLFPDAYRVERSVEIKAPATVVFSRIGDLRQWETWTPWREMDPEMKTTFSDVTTGVGAWQKWDGPKSGQGELTVTASEPPSRLRYDLYFPDFDMRSVGAIELEPAGGGVRVTWSDAGRLGWNPVNRWFGLFLDRMVGADFEKGLARLKELSEAPEAG